MMSHTNETIEKQPPAINLSFALGSLIVLNIIAFAMQFTVKYFFQATTLIPARIFYGVSEGVYWPLLNLVSYSFLHADLMHIGFNMIWLLIFGTPVVQRLMAFMPIKRPGSLKAYSRFYLFYLSAALFCGAFHTVLNPSSTISLIGASGAVSAVMGGSALIMFRTPHKYGPFGGALTPLTFPKFMVFSALVVFVNILTGLGISVTSEDPGNIAWETHIAGYIYGVLVFPFFDRMAAPDRTKLIEVVDSIQD